MNSLAQIDYECVYVCVCVVLKKAKKQTNIWYGIFVFLLVIEWMSV